MSSSNCAGIKLLIPDLPQAQTLLTWLQRIDASRQYTNFGPLVGELEQTLGACWPVQAAGAGLAPLQVITLNTGTAPLELAIAAMELPAAGEVLLPAFTFPATATAVLRNGMQVVFADVAADTWQLTPDMARQAAAHRRLALVIPVATFGCPLDVAAWDSFVDETGIPVLMDAAAAFGNQGVGRKAHASFSLHATKPFGIGEGGLLATRDARMADKVRRLSNFGFVHGQAALLGTNAKLSEYAAAVGLAQWSRWPEMQSLRRTLWASYRDGLAAVPGVTLQSGFEAMAVPASVVLRLTLPAEKAAPALARSGIESRRWYCPPLNQHPVFAACDLLESTGVPALDETNRLAEYTLGVPWHNFMKRENFRNIIKALEQLA